MARIRCSKNHELVEFSYCQNECEMSGTCHDLEKWKKRHGVDTPHNDIKTKKDNSNKIVEKWKLLSYGEIVAYGCPLCHSETNEFQRFCSMCGVRFKPK